MKLHTNLTGPDIGNAILRAKDRGLIAPDVDFAVFEHGRSRTHPHGFTIQLGTHNQDSLPAGYTDQHGRSLRVRRARNSSHGGARWGATWHEWGWLIAEIFTADPGSRWGGNPARSRHPDRAWGYFSPADFHAKTGGQFRPGPEDTAVLRAYREDGTEVRPGDMITMACRPFTFRAAVTESNDSGTDGMIAVDGYPRLFSAPFGLTVRGSEPAASPGPRKPVTEALAAQGDLAPGAPGWRAVHGAQVEDIRAGDLIRVQPVTGPAAEYAIAAVPDPEAGHLDDYLYPRLVTCFGVTLRVAVGCRVTVLRHSTHAMRAGTP